MKTCSISNCGREHHARGLCDTHYARIKRVGNVSANVPVGYSKPGALNPNWKGGEISDGHGQILIYSPQHPNPSWQGTHVYRYRLVVEKHLGRYLTPDEVVHHINENPSDDRIENLQVMSQSEHMKLHQSKRN